MPEIKKQLSDGELFLYFQTLLGAVITSAAAAIPAAAACTAAGAADTFDTALFRLIHIACRGANDDREHQKNYHILHREHPFFDYFFSAYSAARPFSVLWISRAITAAITATTITPPINPLPTDPLIAKVPI